MRYVEINEAYSAGGYSAELWRRWWGNDLTGEVLPVELDSDHDAYLFNNITEFFSQHELAQLPDPDDNLDYEDVHPDDEIQNSHDEILVAAYDKGWNAILYDGNNKHLSMRTSRRAANLPGIRKIVRTIITDTPVTGMTLDMNGKNYEMDDDAIQRFIKFGRLPR